MVKVIITGVPSHPEPLAEKCGVAVMVEIIGINPILLAVKVLIFPVPDAASPISGWLLVHVILENVPVKLTAAEAVPVQIF